MLGWLAWYDDLNVYSSSQIDWLALPSVGLIGIVEFERPYKDTGQYYRRLIHAGDYYWVENDAWHKVPTHEEWGKWAEPPDVPYYITCGVVTDEQYENILAQMALARKAPD